MKNYFLLLGFLCLSLSPSFAQLGAPDIKDMDYTGLGEAYNFLDVYFPDDLSTPRPLVIYIHGGAWSSGSKGNAPRYLSNLVTEHQFIIADINYRLSSEAVFPAQINDVKHAIRFLKSMGAEWNIDTCRIGLTGSSAGGHLAVLAASSQVQQDPYIEGIYPASSAVTSNVHAAAAIGGGMDLTDLIEYPDFCEGPFNTMDHPNSPVSKLLGCQLSDCLDKAQLASPMFYTDSQHPPALLIHGEIDCVTPSSQSINYAQQLENIGVDYQLELYAGFGHDGLPENEIVSQIDDFFINRLNEDISCSPEVTTSSEEFYSEQGWEVYPTLANQYLWLRSAADYKQEDVRIQIIKMDGQIIRSWKTSATAQEIDLNGLQSGMYLLQILSAKNAESHKFIKQ